MNNKLTISLIAFFIIAVTTTSGFSAEQKSQMLLRDGLVLTGVDGKLVPGESNEVSAEFILDRWFFELDSDFILDKGLIKGGTRLEILPSSVLERLTADANKNPEIGYRLAGRITLYRGKNFIFPTYFLPLTKTKKQQPSTPQTTLQQEKRPAINEPNDVLTIPKELIDKLPDKTTRIDLTKRGRDSGKSGTKSNDKTSSRPVQDSILADKYGFIHGTGEEAESKWRQVRFALDSLGRKESKTSFHLLPCQPLEQAENKQSAAPDPLRFKIAGIITRYKGKDYLLLQRATRVYGHGNFPR